MGSNNLCSAQNASDTVTIHILNANSSEFDEQIDPDLKKLIGEVLLKQEDVLFSCDSAYIYEARSHFDAFGNIHINQNDSINIYADILQFEGNQKVAYLYDNVRLTDDETVITADTLVYDFNEEKAILHPKVYITNENTEAWADHVEYFTQNKLAYLKSNVHLKNDSTNIYSDDVTYNYELNEGSYKNGGRVTNKSTVLTSKRAFYEPDHNRVLFEENVFLKDPEYELTTPELRYNTRTEFAQFIGNSKIISKENIVYCEEGYFDRQKDQFSVQSGARLLNPPQFLEADSLFFNNETGLGKAFKNVEWRDTSENILLTSEYAEYQKDEDYLMATDSLLLIQIFDEDSLFIKADTIITFRQLPDSTRLDTVNNLTAYHRVRLFKSDFQAICDSMAYLGADSSFHLYQDPVLWSDANQITADSITLFTAQRQIDSMKLREKSVMVSKKHEWCYDQVMGRYMNASFEKGELQQIDVEGGAQSLYFAQDDDEAFIGLNEARAERITILLKAREVNRVKFYTEPSATFHPIQLIDPKKFRLEHFSWREEERPHREEFH